MRAIALLMCLSLGACATSNTTSSAEAGNDKVAKTANQFGQAATTPLSDLNLIHEDVPAVLIAAQIQPYAAAEDRSCTSIATEVQALDTALGADLDAPGVAKEDGLAEKGVQALGNAAVGAVRSSAEGVLPFRGWLRKLTGAEKRDQTQAAAIAAGTLRRAYLKGMGLSMGCTAPAAPTPKASTLAAKAQ